MKKSFKEFRCSKEAMILDVILLPWGLIYSIIMQGIPGTIKEIKNLPKTYSRGWKNSKWFFFNN